MQKDNANRYTINDKRMENTEIKKKIRQLLESILIGKK